MGAPQHAPGFDTNAYLLGNRLGALQRAARQQDGEFVAAHAGHGIALAHARLEQPGNLSQHLVAGRVACGVADGFEAALVTLATYQSAAGTSAVATR